jgi:hypothetical protein
MQSMFGTLALGCPLLSGPRWRDVLTKTTSDQLVCEAPAKRVSGNWGLNRFELAENWTLRQLTKLDPSPLGFGSMYVEHKIPIAHLDNPNECPTVAQ